MQLAEQLRAAGLLCFPCRADKSPAVPKGVPWALIAQQSPALLEWPSPLVGVPVPTGVVILDLDTYKGVTTQAVDQAIGHPLDWDAALIQTTMRGGKHYAFATDWVVKQGSNVGVQGLDTRVAGKGYICTGGQYVPVASGVFRMSHPANLPHLPDAARPLLELIDHAPERPLDLPEGDRDIDEITEALGHIPPGLGRSEWVRIGLALRHHFHDDEVTGAALFHKWSSGELSPDGAPENYVPETTDNQFYSFKAEGTTTISTLFYAAMQNGWRPPARMAIDTAAAFGADAAGLDEFCAIIDRIQEYGGDPKHTNDLVGDVAQLHCNKLQRDTLVAVLLRELKEAGLLTKAIRDQLDQSPKAPKAEGPQARHSEILDMWSIPAIPLVRPETSHGDNAQSMLREVFGNRVAMLDGQLRWWSGKEWQLMDDELLDTLCFQALSPGKSTASNVAGTRKALIALAPRLPPAEHDRRVYFRNGVLDLGSPGAGLQPHDMHNYNLGTLTVDYNPAAQCPEWGAFVASVFEGTADGTDRRDLLQEVIGYALFKDTLNVQKAIALDGASRAGKSLALEVLHDILGAGTCGVFTFSELSSGKTQSDFRAYDVMIDVEAKPPVRQLIPPTIAFVNKVSSNERVSIPLLNTQTPWKGRLNCKMMIACNGLPTMIDDSGASANRFHILKFTRSFAGSEDRGLLRRLRGELEGIAAWAVQGALRLIGNNGQFTTPLTSQEATDDLKGANQPLLQFLNECATFEPDARCHNCDIWTAYQQWAVGENVRLPSRNSFLRSLNQTLLGQPVERSKAVRVEGKISTGYTGMGIRPPLADAFGPQLSVVK